MLQKRLSTFCFFHPSREAAARCMVCQRFFCRECVSEHELRMLCADCLRREIEGKRKNVKQTSFPYWVVQGLFGLLFLWFTFYLVGRVLVDIPASFHDGEIFSKVIDP